MPTPKEKRKYRREYDEYHGTEEQKKRRAARNKARRESGLKKGDPREADHKKPLSKGGSPGLENVAIVSQKENREKADTDYYTLKEKKRKAYTKSGD
tara:strand:+ start:2247 stop:2537 length:291 start_codon:yes stop_codon:yes gene_type:complete